MSEPIRVPVATEPPYEVLCGRGILAEAKRWAQGRSGWAILVDETLVNPWLERLDAPEDVPVLAVPPGEDSKSLTMLEAVLELLAEHALDRGTLLVALGGGVISDLTGLAASLYMRGVDFLCCPTTLLAQVDASVGGKTAVNLAAGKNLAGTFHQPVAVLADVETLSTLPERELLSGFGEVLKTALIGDAALLDELAHNAARLRARQAEALTPVVARCVAVKARAVADDPREAGPRRALNLGHTFGHAIERAAGYGTIPHGEAVAVGIGLALELARRLGVLEQSDLPERVRDLAASLGLATSLAVLRKAGHPLPVETLLEAMRVDKKGRGGVPRFVLPVRAGVVRWDVEAPVELVRELVA